MKVSEKYKFQRHEKKADTAYCCVCFLNNNMIKL